MGLAVYTAILVAVEVVLAEAAVEGDLVEGAFESSEFLIIQSLDEQFRDPVQVDRSGFGQAVEAGVGQRDHDAACVAVSAGSAHEAIVSHPVDSAGHAGTRVQRPVRELRDAKGPAGLGQLTEHVEIAQSQTGLSFEVHRELPQERGARSQQGTPGAQSAPAGELLRHKAVEEARGVWFRKYLLVQ